MKKFVFITGVLSISLTGLGILFRIIHWHCSAAVCSASGCMCCCMWTSKILLILGVGIFSVLFIPSLAKYLYNNGCCCKKDNPEQKS